MKNKNECEICGGTGKINIPFHKGKCPACNGTGIKEFNEDDKRKR